MFNKFCNIQCQLHVNYVLHEVVAIWHLVDNFQYRMTIQNSIKILSVILEIKHRKWRGDIHSLHKINTYSAFFPYFINSPLIYFLQFVICSYTSMNALGNIISGIASRLTTHEQRDRVRYTMYYCCIHKLHICGKSFYFGWTAWSS
jgi:hypothetical protein